MNKVLVILATYNGEKYVKEQIRSILNQVDVDITLVVFDDNSADDTVEIIKSLEDSRIELHTNKKNSGSPALNFLGAISQLEYDFIQKFSYVALSDQDDIWLSSKLNRGVEKLLSTNSSLYASNLILWDELNDKKNIISKDFKQTRFDYLFEGGSAGCTYVFTNIFALELKSIVCKSNFDNWKFLSHDWLIYFIARSTNRKVFIDTKSFIFYRIHETNIHGQLNKNTFFSYLKRFNLILSQWYFIQSCNFSQLLNGDSEELYIYKMYNKNWFTRTWLIFKYNFRLIRSRTKFIQFALVSLIPRFQRFTL
jgi:rhamnosyltransferase